VGKKKRQLMRLDILSGAAKPIEIIYNLDETKTN